MDAHVRVEKMGAGVRWSRWTLRDVMGAVSQIGRDALLREAAGK